MRDKSTPVYLVSALRGEGLDELLVGIADKLQALEVRTCPGHESTTSIESANRTLQRVRIPEGLPAEEAAQRWRFLREECTVVEESITADGHSVILEARMDDGARSRCIRKFGAGMLV